MITKRTDADKLDMLVTILIGTLVSFWSLRPIWDIDLGWHIAVGRFILANGFPTTDFLSAADPTRPWVTFQGGYEILVAWLDSIGGWFLIRLIHSLTIGFGFVLLWSLTKRLELSTLLRITVTVIALVLYEDRIRVRPHVFHFVFLLAVLHVVIRRAEDIHIRCAAWVWPIQALWAFIHGPASLWGLALLGAVAVASPRRLVGYILFVGGLVTVVVVPGFVDGILSSFRVHTEANIQSSLVPEHWPLWAYPSQITSIHGKIVPALVAVALTFGFIAVALRRSQASQRLALVFASFGMGVFSVLLARFAWYSVVPLMLGLSLFTLSTRLQRLVFFIAIIVLVADVTTYVLPRFSGVSRITTDLQPGVFPERAADYLHEAGITGKIHTSSTWGGYLLYRLHPPSTTLTDGRIAFGGEVAALLQRDKPSTREDMANEIHDRFGIDLLVSRAPTFALNRPKPSQWLRLYGDGTAEVWAVRDEQLAGRIARTKAYASQIRARQAALDSEATP